MPVDSDLLGSCGLRLESEIFSDGTYSLCRVDYQGRKLVAEISAESDVYQHRWPSIDGLITPISARDLPNQQKLVLFDTGEDRFLCEMLVAIGGFAQGKAVAFTGMVLAIVSNLQAAGMICGYLGPEMFVTNGTELYMLAGRRGIPVSPFTAQEVQSSRPSDPRSDVSALGSFLFRIVVGTDVREEQLKLWDTLPVSMQAAIQSMVAASPQDRPNGLQAVRVLLKDLMPTEPEASEETILGEVDGFLRKERAPTSSRIKSLYWIVGSIILLVLVYFTLISSGPPPKEIDAEVVSTSVTTDVLDDHEEIDSPWVDTVAVVDAVQTIAEIPIVDSARIWISNCSGIPDAELAFRAGPVCDYSYVYPLSGTTNRQSSLILARRADPYAPLENTSLGQAVYQIADTSFAVMPVDLTIMLGTDLKYAGINSQFLHSPEAPAGTLFVDVVNHGIQYSLEGMGAATWIASKIEGKACDIEGTEWLIAISDIRDADRFSEEIGIPEVLEETLFLYKRSSIPIISLEDKLRQFFQSLPASAEFPVETVPIPDIHILISKTFKG